MIGYAIRRQKPKDPPQISAWFRADGWIIAREAAAFFTKKEDAVSAITRLYERQPGYRYSIDPVKLA